MRQFERNRRTGIAERRSVATEADYVVADRSCIAPGWAGAATTGIGGGDRRMVAGGAASRCRRNPVSTVPGDSDVARLARARCS